jgi:hypothetical protein
VHTYLAEAYMPRGTGSGLEAVAGRLAAACAAVSRPRRAVRYLRALHLPGDELCLYLFEASSPDLVTAAVTGAGLRYIRIVEAVPADAPPATAGSSPGRPPS